MGERKRSMLRIAVCDDEKIYIDNISDLVKKYSEKKSVEIDVYQFKRSFDLLDRIEEGELYDAFLLDIYMPGISGMDVAEELRKKHIKAPVIFLTSSPDHAIEAFEVSATHYILKPISEEKISRAAGKQKQTLKNLNTSDPVREKCRRGFIKCSDHYHDAQISPRFVRQIFCCGGQKR